MRERGEKIIGVNLFFTPGFCWITYKKKDQVRTECLDEEKLLELIKKEAK